MAGTIPLSSQVPDNAPIKSKISIASIEELMLFNIPCVIVLKSKPNRPKAIAAATAPESSSTI